jgi:hypothetical protein
MRELTLNLRPDVISFAIPNGGLRNQRVAMQLKAEGLRAGMPDLGFAMEGGRVAWLEMKNQRGALSDMQWGIRRRLESLGHQWAMARSVEEALEHLDAFGVLR